MLIIYSSDPEVSIRREYTHQHITFKSHPPAPSSPFQPHKDMVFQAPVTKKIACCNKFYSGDKSIDKVGVLEEVITCRLREKGRSQPYSCTVLQRV